MKFTKSPSIELKVANSTLTLQQDNASMHVGTSVWPCSLVLTKFLDHHSTTATTLLATFPTARAIELGAGCGAVGMGLYLLGLHNLILTDIAAVMPALKHNLKINKPVLKKTLKFAQLIWGNTAQMTAVAPPFDVVVAADVVYIVDTVKPLVDTMLGLVKDDGVVLLGYQVRCPEADVLFWELVREVFRVEKVMKQDLHPEYSFEETDVFIFRKKMKMMKMTTTMNETITSEEEEDCIG